MTTKPHVTITHLRREPNDEDEISQRPLQLSLIWRMFGYTKPHARRRNWLFALVIIRAIQLPMLAWALGAVINGPISRHDPHRTVWGAVGFLALAAVTQFCFHFRQRLALELGESVIQDLRRDIFQHLLRMPMSFYNHTKIGRIISRYTSDAEAMRVGWQDVFFITAVQAGQMIVSGLLMVWYDWVLFLVVLAMAPVLAALNYHFRRTLSLANRQVQESWSRVTATLAESVTGIRVTQGFVRQDVNAGLFTDLIKDHSGYNLGVARASGVFLPMLELSSQTFAAALIVIGGYRVLNPSVHMQVGTLIQFFFLANMFFSSVQPIGQQYSQALTAMAGAERVFRLLDTKPDWEEPPTARELPRVEGRVEFRHVIFSYIPDRPAINDMSFIVEPGQTVALVGHTGSGKSSIINLIAKFYLPQTGQVLIDGFDTREILGDSLHRQMGIVSQQNFLFTGTVMENTRFTRPIATDEEVIDAVRKLDFLDVIGSLSAGFSTQVGERGTNLSLGERQLVCFARAMLADPRILILDEATSSVDAMTEARIQRALTRLLKGRTSFVVAHRLSTIRHADLVLVLDHGKIIERGTHRQLIAANGAYAELYRQFVRK
ncbi:MAG TPA: ABC transporter ATP-binding protein [Verrucomicrobiae bacterium]|nr:ABC transporter ATP-binding protein [Verrucomicrobiae bacterium]